MHLPASLHLTDALYGLAIGTAAAGAVALATVRRPAAIRAASWWAAASAGLLAMYVARGVRHDLFDDVRPGAALVAIAVGLVAGIGWSRLMSLLGDRWLVSVVLVSGVGVWAAVPDTETSVAVLAAWLPFAAWASIVGPKGADAAPRAAGVVSGACAAGVALAWAAAWGASAREQALPGALACFGVALVVVVMAPRARTRVVAGLLLGVHVPTVWAGARWATATATLGGGIVRASVVVLACAFTVALVVAFSRRGDEPVPPRPSDPAVRPG